MGASAGLASPPPDKPRWSPGEGCKDRRPKTPRISRRPRRLKSPGTAAFWLEEPGHILYPAFRINGLKAHHFFCYRFLRIDIHRL